MRFLMLVCRDTEPVPDAPPEGDIEEWVTNEEDCWQVGASLEDTPHHRLITAVQARNLTRRDETEMRADDMVQYESADRKRARRY